MVGKICEDYTGYRQQKIGYGGFGNVYKLCTALGVVAVKEEHKVCCVLYTTFTRICVQLNFITRSHKYNFLLKISNIKVHFVSIRLAVLYYHKYSVL